MTIKPRKVRHVLRNLRPTKNGAGLRAEIRLTLWRNQTASVDPAGPPYSAGVYFGDADAADDCAKALLAQAVDEARAEVRKLGPSWPAPTRKGKAPRPRVIELPQKPHEPGKLLALVEAFGAAK